MTGIGAGDAAIGFPTRAPIELEDRPRRQQWLIDGLWGRQAVGIVGGEPKCGKSFLALDIAVAVAAGVPWPKAPLTVMDALSRADGGGSPEEPAPAEAGGRSEAEPRSGLTRRRPADTPTRFPPPGNDRSAREIRAISARNNPGISPSNNLRDNSRVRRRYFSPECAPRHRGRQFRRISMWGPSAAGFMVRRHAARTILARCVGARMSIDHLLFNLRISRLARELQPVQVLPGLVRQRRADTSSDIRPWKNEVRLPVRARLRRHCMSAPRKAFAVGAWLAGYGARVAVEFADHAE